MNKLLMILFLLPVIAFAQTGPKLVVEGGENINAGSHMRGQEVNYEIQFKNVGDADLAISGVSTTCGCSSALVSSNLVKPGERGLVKFTFNGQAFGTVTKSVTISTNETPTAYHTINVSMNMVEPVTVSPQSIVTEGKVGDELKQSVTVLNSLGKQVEIVEVGSNTPVIKVVSDKMTLGAGESASLSISIMILEESAINAAVIIKTTEGEIQIPVLVEVKAKE